MEIHQLRYFVAVAETAGFSRAAERCNVAQPSLSQQILKLEEELDQKLFDRLGRKVVLTDAGRALLPRARAILKEVQEIRKVIYNEIDCGKGKLSVGFIQTIPSAVLVEAVRYFKEIYPEAELELTESLAEYLIDGLINTKFDVCFMSLPIHNKLIASKILLIEPLLMTISRYHKLAQQEVITTQELEKLPFIAVDEIHCLGKQIQSFCYEHQINLEVICYASQLSTVQNFVGLDLGVSLIPKICTTLTPSPNCVYRPLIAPPPRRSIVAAWHVNRSKSLLAKHFIDYVASQYSSYVRRL